MEVGVDIVKIERMNAVLNKENFFNKYFAKSEVEYIESKNNKIETIAGLFAAKEAFLKAVKLGIGGGLNLNQVCVCHDKKGSPNIEITPEIMFYLQQHGCSNISLSISHDGEYAVAFCTIY